MLVASIDAGSTTDGIFTVAGVAFGEDQVKQASSQWRQVMGDRVFHMTDLHSRRAAFKGVRAEEVDDIMRGLVEILNASAASIVAISCDLHQEVGPFAKQAAAGHTSAELRNLSQSPYGLLCHLCMYALGRFAQMPNSIRYFLEAGDIGQKGLLSWVRFLEKTDMSVPILTGYSFAGLSVVSKSNMQAVLQSADFIAWEWAKHVARHRQGRPVRRSFNAVINGAPTVHDTNGFTITDQRRYFFRHLSGLNRDRYINVTKSFVEAATFEDINSALDTWDTTRGG